MANQGSEKERNGGYNFVFKLGELLVVHSSPALFIQNDGPTKLLEAFDLVIFLGEVKKSVTKSQNMIKVLTRHGKGWVFQKDVSFAHGGYINDEDLKEFWVA